MVFPNVIASDFEGLAWLVIIVIAVVLQIVKALKKVITGKEEDGNSFDQGEDKEQKNLAKRFARRARMNRLLEIYGDEKEFSQSGLIDQDEDLQKELKSIRVSVNHPTHSGW